MEQQLIIKLLAPLIGWGLDFQLDDHQTLILDLFCQKILG